LKISFAEVEEHARAMGIDHAEIARRKDYLSFEDDDILILQQLHSYFKPRHRGHIDAFYEHLLQFEELREFLRDDTTIARLKQVQVTYFQTLLAGRYDWPYVMLRMRVGIAHHRIGLTPQWYIGAYQKYLSVVEKDMWAFAEGDIDRYLKVRRAISKIVFFDMGLAFDIYAHLDREKLRSVEKQLAVAQKREALGTLAAGVAHEINSPLTYVIQNIDSVMEDLLASAAVCRPTMEPGRDKAPLPDLLARLRDAADGVTRVRQIVRDLKDFSRAGEESVGAVEVNRIMEKALKMTASEYRFRARLEKDLAEVPPVRADEGRLIQIFVNLVVNAAQSLPEERGDANVIGVKTWCDGASVCISIQDTGKGISRENTERIFDPFFTTRTGVGGTGLGLSICRNLVESYGGRIDVESSEGVGTKFTIALPALTGEVSRVAEPDEKTKKPERLRRRILLVDDEPALLRAVVRILEKRHEVRTASDGQRALELLERDERFDLILCDLMMPGISGMKLHVLLRRSHPALAERMVFMTGGVFTDSAREFLASVPNRCLEKPFTADEIEGLIAEICATADPGVAG
jgi:signal transduction histidine kinase/CheY-like chemotaxis protein